MRTPITRWLLSLVIVNGFCETAVHAGTWYRIDELGASEGHQTGALAIDISGHIVGKAETTTGEYYFFAALWDAGNPQAAPLALGNSNQAWSYANDVNNSGLVVGRIAAGDGSPRPYQAAIWNANDPTAAPLELGGIGGNYAEAYGINGDGVAVGRGSGPSGVLYDAVLWICNGAVQSHALTTLGGNGNSAAYDVNDSALVVGQSVTAAGSTHAALWDWDPDDPTAAPRDLGTLGGTTSVANAVNEDGYAVGFARTSDGNNRAVVWNVSDPAAPSILPTDLGTLGGSRSVANDINAGALAVGYADDANGNSRAALWDLNHQTVTNLNEWLVNGEGWELSQAQAINDFGQIVGWGYLNGQKRQFVLSAVPEPSGLVSLLGIATAYALLAVVRRRSQCRVSSPDQAGW